MERECAVSGESRNRRLRKNEYIGSEDRAAGFAVKRINDGTDFPARPSTGGAFFLSWLYCRAAVFGFL